MTNEKLPEILSRRELAKYLNVSERTIRNYELKKKLTPMQMGGKKYYALSEVLKIFVP